MIFLHYLTTNKAHNQSVNQSINRTINQSISQSISQSVSQSVSLSVSQSVSQSVSLSVSQSVSQSVCQSVDRSVGRSVSQSVCQSVSQSVNPPTNPPTLQKASKSPALIGWVGVTYTGYQKFLMAGFLSSTAEGLCSRKKLVLRHSVEHQIMIARIGVIARIDVTMSYNNK